MTTTSGPGPRLPESALASPRPPYESLELALERQHGTFTRAQALASGISPDEARRNLSKGFWTTIRRGVYVDTTTWRGASDARRAVLGLQALVLKTAPEVVGSHETAAAAHGIELWDGSFDHVHVTRPDASGRREAGAWHHRAALDKDERVRVDGLLVTSPVRTGWDLARSGIDHEHAQVAVDSALRVAGSTFAERVTRQDELRAMHERRADWPGARVASRAVALSDPRAQSVGESRTRYHLVQQGLGWPLSQLYVYDERERLVGIVDHALVAQKVVVEFDGRVKYGLDGLDPEAVAAVLAREKQREEALRRLGWEVVRVVWADLFHPGRLAERVRDAIARGAMTAPLRGSYDLGPG